MRFNCFRMSIIAFVLMIHYVSSADSSLELTDRPDGAMDRDWKGGHHHHHSAEIIVAPAAPSIVDQGVAASGILNAIFNGVTSIAKVAAVSKAISNANQPPPPVYPGSHEDQYDPRKPVNPVRPSPYYGWVFDDASHSWKYTLPTNGWAFDEVSNSWKYKLPTNGWVFDDASYTWVYRP